MNRSEFEKEQKLDYYELVQYLQVKYGLPKKPYFRNKKCKSRSAISRTKEGLVIHHVKEDEAILLSDAKNALKYPFDFQEPKNLCYCNILEHALLHAKIILNENVHIFIEKNKDIEPAINGFLYYLVPEINSYFLGSTIKTKWKKDVFKVVDNNYEDFALMLIKFKKAYLDLNSKYPDNHYFSYVVPVKNIIYLTNSFPY